MTAEDRLPADVTDEAERLTRLAREATDENEAAAYRERREALLADHGYVSRIRSEGSDETLVLHPAEWIADGRVRPGRIDDLDRGVERPRSGTGEADDWDAVDAHNRAVVRAVEREHGPVHAANARAFADFMGNHYAKPIEDATPAERREFRTEYFPRNVWPTDEQRAVVEASIELTVETARTLDGEQSDTSDTDAPEPGE